MRSNLILKIVLFLLGAFLVVFFLQKNLGIDVSDLEKIVGQFGLLAPAAYSLLLFLGLTIPFNPISDYLLVNLAAFLFRPEVSILATFFAHSLALSTNYYLSRRFGWKLIDKFNKTTEENYLKNLAARINPSSIFYLRWLLPLTAVGIDLLSYGAGLAKLPFNRFFIASIIPWTILNILFFTSTKFLISRALLLFFLPGLILVATPLAVYLIAKRVENKPHTA